MKNKEIILLIVILLALSGIVYTCTDSKNRIYNSVDTEPPFVEKIEPTSRARFIDINSDIKIYFDKNMDKNTINNSNIYIKDQNGSNIDISITYDNKIAQLKPLIPLLNNMKYTVTVSKNNKDQSGNSLEMAFTSEFKTRTADIPIIQTGQTKSYNNFDDGYYKKGYPRNFIRDDFNKVVEDQYTGQQWLDNDDVYNKKRTYAESKQYCSNLVYAEHKDWRMPNKAEMSKLINYKNKAQLEPIFNEQKKGLIYWLDYSSSETNNITFQLNKSINFVPYSTKKELNTRCIRGVKLDGNIINQSSEIKFGDNKIHKDNIDVFKEYNMMFYLSIFDSEKKSFKNSIQFCEDSKKGGFNNWRLANMNETIIRNNIFGTTSTSLENEYFIDNSKMNVNKLYDNIYKYIKKPIKSYPLCVRDIK